MTTTMSPLPVPFSKNKPHFTANQVLLYATQARADLEAENKRLREALLYAVKQVPELGTVPGIAAALENRA